MVCLCLLLNKSFISFSKSMSLQLLKTATVQYFFLYTRPLCCNLHIVRVLKVLTLKFQQKNRKTKSLASVQEHCTRMYKLSTDPKLCLGLLLAYDWHSSSEFTSRKIHRFCGWKLPFPDWNLQ